MIYKYGNVLVEKVMKHMLIVHSRWSAIRRSLRAESVTLSRAKFDNTAIGWKSNAAEFYRIIIVDSVADSVVRRRLSRRPVGDSAFVRATKIIPRY